MLLQPTTTEDIRLSSGKLIRIQKAMPEFPLWTGIPPSSTYGGKAVVDYHSRPAFAELAILWSLQDLGWRGAWVTHAGGKEVFRVGLMDEPPTPTHQMPNDLLAWLKRIRAVRGTSRGTWDVCCVKDGTFLFAESKRKGRDRMKPDQIDWLEAALTLGLPASSFIIVEWSPALPTQTGIPPARFSLGEVDHSAVAQSLPPTSHRYSPRTAGAWAQSVDQFFRRVFQPHLRLQNSTSGLLAWKGRRRSGHPDIEWGPVLMSVAAAVLNMLLMAILLTLTITTSLISLFLPRRRRRRRRSSRAYSGLWPGP